MSLAQELGFVRQHHPEVPVDRLEQTLECRLTGAGFDSWEGIAATGPPLLLLASAPGVFSRGRVWAIPWADVRQVGAAAEEITVAFRSPDGEDRTATLTPGNTTREEDWADLALALLVRHLGAVPRGAPLPACPLLPPLAETAEPLAEAIAALAAQFPRLSRLGVWQGAVLLAAERPGRAREVLERLEGVPEPDRPAWARLLAMAALLSGKSRLARALIEATPAGPTESGDPEDPDGRAQLRLLLLADAMLEGLPGETSHPGPGRPLRHFPERSATGAAPFPTPAAPRFPFLRGYQAHRLFQIDGYAALRETAWGPRGWLLEAWSALGAGFPTIAEDRLERYRKCPTAVPLELVRLEAALRHFRGETDLAFRLLQTAGTPELDHPLLHLALRLGRTDTVAVPPHLERLPMLAPDLLLTWIEFLLVAGRRDEAATLLQASASRREALPPLQQVQFRVCEAESLLQAGQPIEAGALVQPVLRLAGLTPDGDPPPPCLADHDLDLFVHPAWPEYLAGACLIWTEVRIATGDPLTAHRFLEYARALAGSTPGPVVSARLTCLGARLMETAGQTTRLPADRPPVAPGLGSGTDALSPPAAGASLAGRTPGPLAGSGSGPPAELDALSALLRAGHLDRLTNLWNAAIADGPGEVDGDLAADLAALPRCVDRPLLVAVMGEFNAGKSTLLNALLGEPLLPTGITPTTRLPCLVRWGPAPLLLAIDRAGGRSIHPVGDAHHLLDERVEDGRQRDLLCLELAAPHPLLRDLWFLDLPGLNSRFARHADGTRSFLREADAIWWVSNATQLGQATERSALGDLVRPWQRVWAILNHLDEISEPERPEVVAAHAAWMQDHATVLAAVAARPATACPADRAAWEAWFAPFRRAAPAQAREAVRRRLNHLASRVAAVAQAGHDRLRTALGKSLSGSALPDAPAPLPPPDEPVWGTLAAQARALLEGGEARSALGRARVSASLQDLAEAMVEAFQRPLHREAGSLLFSALEAWAGVANLPGGEVARTWESGFRARGMARLATGAQTLRAAFWEAVPVLLLVAGTGQGSDPVALLRDALTAHQIRWLDGFRADLGQAHQWLGRWAEVRLAGREHALLLPLVRELEALASAVGQVSTAGEGR